FLQSGVDGLREVNLSGFAEDWALGFQRIEPIDGSQNRKHEPGIVFLIGNGLRKGAAELFQQISVSRHAILRGSCGLRGSENAEHCGVQGASLTVQCCVGSGIPQGIPV
ncbi:MAG: hypothetical protein ACK5YO_12810, partial [Planctomyces sp.]